MELFGCSDPIRRLFGPRLPCSSRSGVSLGVGKPAAGRDTVPTGVWVAAVVVVAALVAAIAVLVIGLIWLARGQAMPRQSRTARGGTS